MKNKLTHYLYIFTPIVIISVIVFVSIKFLLPMIAGIGDKRTELAAAKEKLVRMQTKRTTLETVSSVYAQFLKDAQLALPSEKNPETILTAIENISIQTQFAIDNIGLNPGAISTDSAKAAGNQSADIKRGAEFLSMNIKAQGATAQLPNFLNFLQQSRRLFDILNLNLSFADENIITVDVSLVAYYLPAVTQIGAVDADLPKITDREQKILQTLAQMPVTTEVAISTVSGQVPIGKTDLFSW